MSDLKNQKDLRYNDALGVYEQLYTEAPNKLKVKLLNEKAKLPTRANMTDAGFDLYISDFDFSFQSNQRVITYKMGISIEIPKGYVGLLFPRSSIYKGGTSMANAVGVIDSGYRGEIMAKFYYEFGNEIADVGDRVVQLVLVALPDFEVEVVEELDNTGDRCGGFGSSGF